MMALATCFTPFQPGLWNALTLSGCALGGPLQHRENFLLAHDYVVLIVDLDLRSGILPEQDPVARLYVHRFPLPALGLLARAYSDNLALHRLLPGGVGYDDATLDPFLLLDALDQNAVVQGSHFHGWCLLIEIHVLCSRFSCGDLPGCQ